MPIATTTELGAVCCSTGRVQFGVWAPHARSVAVRLGEDHPLGETGGGFWAGEVPASPGDDYRFVLDGDEFRLATLRGQKVVLVSWAPY